MNSLSTDVKSSVIIFHDHSKVFISAAQELAVLQGQTQGAKGIKIDGNFYTFSSMSKLLSMESYHEQYPNERLEYVRNSFEENYPEYARGGSDQIRKPTSRARELMIQGIKQAFKEMGKDESEAEKCLAEFTTGYSRKMEYWKAIWEKFRSFENYEGKDDEKKNSCSWAQKAKKELEAMKV